MLFLKLTTLRAWRRASIAAGVLLGLTAATGCSSGEANTGGEDEPIVQEETEVTIQFQPSTDLRLAPLETAPLKVSVSPSFRQEVTFEILTDEPGFDGFLLESTAQVGTDGTATVQFQAPSMRTENLIIIRASIDDDTFHTRQVEIGVDGFGSVMVEPLYEGKREITQWTASAFANSTCEDLESFFDDSSKAGTGSSGATITNIETGGPIAVTLRGNRLVSGCVTVHDLGTEQVENVVVEVSDLPIDVETGTIELSLGVDSSTTDFASHLEEAILGSSTYFRGQNETEGAALLALMAGELEGTNEAAFSASVTTYDLAHALDVQFGSGTPISGAIRSMLTDAAGMISGERTFIGELRLAGDRSEFFLTQAAGVLTASNGFVQSSMWTATAESEDTLILGGSLTYEPIPWLMAIAEQNAQLEVSPEVWILEQVGCDEVAMTLLAATPEEGTHPECTEECLTRLCEDAVTPVWSGLRTAPSQPSTLHVAATGEAELYGAAEIASLDGTWIGRIDEDETSIGGDVGAEVLPDAP